MTATHTTGTVNAGTTDVRNQGMTDQMGDVAPVHGAATLPPGLHRRSGATNAPRSALRASPTSSGARSPAAATAAPWS